MARPPDEQRPADAVLIRAANEKDRDAIWKIFQATISAGDAFVFSATTSRQKALGYWCADDTATFVAEQNGKVLGSYILRANQPGLGDHVANAGFMVDPDAHGLGVGRAMGEHCLDEARRRGYRAMQFNFVVSTNESALHLWRELGFHIVGTLPGAFRHAQKGFVDVYVMFRSLAD
jgi:ribosomal protein S18 acetylase RimI-like enzyme